MSQSNSAYSNRACSERVHLSKPGLALVTMIYGIRIRYAKSLLIRELDLVIGELDFVINALDFLFNELDLDQAHRSRDQVHRSRD